MKRITVIIIVITIIGLILLSAYLYNNYLKQKEDVCYCIIKDCKDSSCESFNDIDSYTHLTNEECATMFDLCVEPCEMDWDCFLI